MGYISHRAIVVTSWDRVLLRTVRQQAAAIALGHVSEVVESTTNGYASFFVAPDGSKEGWERSDQGNVERDAIIAMFEATRYEDGSSPLAWVEVQYGDDDLETCVTRDSDEKRRADGVDRGEAAMNDYDGPDEP